MPVLTKLHPLKLPEQPGSGCFRGDKAKGLEQIHTPVKSVKSGWFKSPDNNVFTIQIFQEKASRT